MSQKIKLLGLIFNVDSTQEILDELQNLHIDISTEVICNKELKIYEVLEKTNLSQIDFILCQAKDLPESLPESLDFFILKDFSQAIIFQSNNAILKTIRQFFCPPIAFVGGGPGNPEWLTLEAQAQLESCDVVFYDALVNPIIVASLKNSIERIFVGKRGDSDSFDQSTINNLMLNTAKKGLKVVRLKGGDPGIFGRITEEIDLLILHQIGYSICPGISSMQSICSTGIHLTQRGVCDRITLTTARSAGGYINNIMPFKDQSLIIYMGILSTEQIQQQLLSAGYEENFPCAILINLSRPNQHVIHTTLKNLHKTCVESHIRPPGLLLFGAIAHQDLLRITPFSPLLHHKVLISNSVESEKIIQELHLWGATSIELNSEKLLLQGKVILPDYTDIILLKPHDVIKLYDKIGANTLSPESHVFCLGQTTLSTFSCLFRRPAIAVDHADKLIKQIKKTYFKQISATCFT